MLSQDERLQNLCGCSVAAAQHHGPSDLLWLQAKWATFVFNFKKNPMRMELTGEFRDWVVSRLTDVTAVLGDATLAPRHRQASVLTLQFTMEMVASVLRIVKNGTLKEQFAAALAGRHDAVDGYLRALTDTTTALLQQCSLALRNVRSVYARELSVDGDHANRGCVYSAHCLRACLDVASECISLPRWTEQVLMASLVATRAGGLSASVPPALVSQARSCCPVIPADLQSHLESVLKLAWGTWMETGPVDDEGVPGFCSELLRQSVASLTSLDSVPHRLADTSEVAFANVVASLQCIAGLVSSTFVRLWQAAPAPMGSPSGTAASFGAAAPQPGHVLVSVLRRIAPLSATPGSVPFWDASHLSGMVLQAALSAFVTSSCCQIALRLRLWPGGASASSVTKARKSALQIHCLRALAPLVPAPAASLGDADSAALLDVSMVPPAIKDDLVRQMASRFSSDGPKSAMGHVLQRLDAFCSTHAISPSSCASVVRYAALWFVIQGTQPKFVATASTAAAASAAPLPFFLQDLGCDFAPIGIMQADVDSWFR